MTSEEIKKANYETIIQASKELLLKKPLKETTFIDIAEASHVAKRTVINIFGTKTNLVFLVLVSVMDNMFEELGEVMESDTYRDAEGLEQIMMLLVARAKFYYKEPYFARLISDAEEFVITNDLERENFNCFLQRMDDIWRYFREPLQKGRSDGSINPNIEEKDIRTLLTFTFGAIAQRLSMMRTNAEFAENVDVMDVMRSNLSIMKHYLMNQK